MEDSARLALIELAVHNNKTFENFLNELLTLINNILENPHDIGYRRIPKDVLKDILVHDAFRDYLKYLGFELKNGVYEFPMDKPLSPLRGARGAVERKITYCYGPGRHISSRIKTIHRKKECQLKPVNVLTTSNRFLNLLQTMFNDVLRYEEEEVQEMARSHIPLTTLQLRAIHRMREYQRKIKTGNVKDEDLSYEMALLSELLSWFKHEFFTWVDKPPCPLCGGVTAMCRRELRDVEGETCRVECYECTECERGKVEFPRHNELRALLRTRRGRCGEFAGCFTLVCRALGYDTRHVWDNADHVWCEVFDCDSNSWIHVDPSECKMDAPLMYSHGWGKNLTYVIAVSRDDIQDVTWRYTYNHNEVLTRRKECTEQELIQTLLSLRWERQKRVSTARRGYLARRNLKELVHLMLERKPESYESEGRLSGSLEWRTQRGEVGDLKRHVYEVDRPCRLRVQYCTSQDLYTVCQDGVVVDRIQSWSAGVYESNNIFMKREQDWKQVYLAREEGTEKGTVAWKLAIADNKRLEFDSFSVRATTAIYENGNIEWSLQLDDEKPMLIDVGESTWQHRGRFKSCVLRATLAGGRGAVAWQHAQLFRQHLQQAGLTAEMCARAVPTDTDGHGE